MLGGRTETEVFSVVLSVFLPAAAALQLNVLLPVPQILIYHRNND